MWDYIFAASSGIAIFLVTKFVCSNVTKLTMASNIAGYDTKQEIIDKYQDL